MPNQHTLGKTIILGCGYTGQVLARKLRLTEASVLATTRSPEKAAELQADGIETAIWSAPEPLPIAADTAFVLFPPRGLEPQKVAQLLRPIERVVYCSSTSVYGPQQGGWVTEDSPVSPKSPWGHARVAAEEALLAEGHIVVRAAGIYGPGRSILNRLRAGRLRMTGDLDRPVNMIHVDDLAHILMAAAIHAQPGQVLLAACGNPVAWRDLAQTASELTGIPLPPVTPMPADPNLRMFYEETKRCRPTRLGELGVQLAYPDTLTALRGLHITK